MHAYAALVTFVSTFKNIIKKMVYFFCIFLVILGLLVLGLLCIRLNKQVTLQEIKQRTSARKVIGFFHPFCDAGGGGEKVLFQALHALQTIHKMDTNLNFRDCKIIIYSGSSKTPKEILSQVRSRFSIDCEVVDFI